MAKSPRQIIEDTAIEATKRFTDEGKLIEAGFAAMRVLMLQHASPLQVSEMRLAYLAGAEHVWQSIMSIMDPGLQETENDLRRMDMIQKEIDSIRAELSERVQPAQGRG